MQFSEFIPGRRFIGRLPHKEDLITTVEAFCVENNIKMATFTIIGALTSVTLGFYDQKQQVYVTTSKNEPYEIASCNGNISIKDGKTFAHVHAVLANEAGNSISGHLFSDTIIFAGEIELQELKGNHFKREHDKTTGLMLWNIPK